MSPEDVRCLCIDVTRRLRRISKQRSVSTPICSTPIIIMAVRLSRAVNWSVPPITHRSRDNFPNPVTAAANPYVPQNSPAIGDLFDLFDFSSGNHR